MEKKISENSFTKQDTLALKGIAILLMVFHHCFHDKILFTDYIIDFTPFSEESVMNFALFAKVCVAIFVFITGYGLTKFIRNQSKNYMLSSQQFKVYTYTRLIKLMAGYWFIYILSSVFCFFMDHHQLAVYFDGVISADSYISGIVRMLLDMFGLSILFGYGLWQNMMNADWWYMSLAILLVLIAPFVNHIVHKYNFLWITLMCVFVPRMLTLNGENVFVSWLFMFAIGVYFAQNDVFAKLRAFKLLKNPKLNTIVMFILATAILIELYYIFIHLDVFRFWEIKTALIPTYLICYCYLFIICLPGVRQILCFLGKHALTIWLVHDIIKYIYFSDFIYSFKYFGLIYVVIFLLSVAVSVVLDFLKEIIGYNKLVDRIVRKVSVKCAENPAKS